MDDKQSAGDNLLTLMPVFYFQAVIIVHQEDLITASRSGAHIHLGPEATSVVLFGVKTPGFLAE